MALAFTATSTRQEIAQRCPSFQDFLGTLQRLRREHPTAKLDVGCLYSSFKSFCSTRRRTTRKHGCEEDCSYEKLWPVYCEKNILASPSAAQSLPSPSDADGEQKHARSTTGHPPRAADVTPDLVTRLEHHSRSLLH